MTSRQLPTILESLREIGLLTHLDNEEIRAAYEEVKRNNYDGAQLLYHLPNIICGFDSEYWWDPSVSESYVKLIGELSDISRGDFSPTNVTVLPGPDAPLDDGDRLTVSFDLAGRTFSQSLELRGDSVDLGFIDAINQALREVGEDGQYYWINTGDQMVVVVFLTEQQFPVVREILGPDLRPWDDIYNWNLDG